MSLRSASFRALADRLTVAAADFTRVADQLDAVATTPPAVVPRRPVEGVDRPVEDLVVARESAGIYAGLAAVRAEGIQAVLRAERAFEAASSAVASYDGATAA